jgi:pyridoxal phosphate enzyme (YggS family)
VTAPHDDERRRAELVTSLGTVRARIAAACEAAGRDSRTVTLVAVTKTYPATDVATLVRLGAGDVGESRDQEARAKVAETARLLAVAPEPAPAPTWHFVGRVQSRKARSIASYAGVVHSVDREKLVHALAEGARARDRPLDVFVQVSLDDDPERGGVPGAQVGQLADAVAGCPELRLRGLMAVPPLGADPDAAFARLRSLADQLRDRYPEADAISAGMSDDLEAAIRHGSTHVRVGTALLGRRPPLFS